MQTIVFISLTAAATVAAQSTSTGPTTQPPLTLGKQNDKDFSIKHLTDCHRPYHMRRMLYTVRDVYTAHELDKWIRTQDTRGWICLYKVFFLLREPHTSDSSLTFESSATGVATVLVTAYSITSAFSSAGHCFVNSEGPTTLTSTLSVVSSASVAPSDFQSSIEFALGDYLGFSACSRSGTEVAATAIIPNVYLITSTTADFSTTQPASVSAYAISTPSYLPSQAGLATPQKAGIGVGVSLGSISVLLLCLILWRKLRQRRLGNAQRKAAEFEVPEHEPTVPYLQAKAELEDEGSRVRRLELEARRRMYELDERGRLELDTGVACVEMANQHRSSE